MNDELMTCTHLTPQIMAQDLSADMLVHIATCDYCAELFAGQIEQSGLLFAPKDLEASILRSSKRLDVQMSAKSKEVSKQLMLFYYSLKVGTAVLGALLLLSRGTIFMERAVPIYEKAQTITNEFHDFSIKNFQPEVNNYDK